MNSLDHTHELKARSWLASANAAGSDFPIQNLPFGVFRRKGSSEPFRGGVAIGDQVLDLAALVHKNLISERSVAQPALNDYLALGPAAWRVLRHALFGLLQEGMPNSSIEAVRGCLVPQAEAEYSLPVRIGDYSDFYTSYYHALNAGRLMVNATSVSPNFHSMPIGYHGRASSIGVSGQPVRRPCGQLKPPGAQTVRFGACEWLDYELELGIFVGTGNALGVPVPLEKAEEHLFGVCLLNDWSARDIQTWEMFPLGPFLAKSFATTISPWIVTMDALAPYRTPWHVAPDRPKPLPYLDTPANREHGGIDIGLEVWLEPSSAEPARLSRTSFRHQHWTPAQMLAHHTVAGCNLQPGDLLGTGTVSGPEDGEAGAMLELSHAGRKPIRLAGSAEERTFLLDGDTMIFRGWCEKPGHARIGFGECRAQVLPALAA